MKQNLSGNFCSAPKKIFSRSPMSIGIFSKSRGIVKKLLLKQLYFSFIHNHLNYANIALASTYKSKLEVLYRHQKHAARIISFKDRFTHAQSLLHDMKALKHLSNKFISQNLFYVQMPKEDSSSYFP